MTTSASSFAGPSSAFEEPPAIDLRDPIGIFHTWWRGDGLTLMPALPGLSIESTTDVSAAVRATGFDDEEIVRRLRQRHELWLASSDGVPVGWGWSAHDGFAIGELEMERALPDGNRYLWDFFTRPPWRGQGIYPRILQAIVTRDIAADHFWLGHDLGNRASQRGIAKAGFREVGLLYRQPDGGLLLVPKGDRGHALAASRIFNVPLADIQRNHSP